MIRSVSVRSGTTAEWADVDPSDQSAAPVLGVGELGVDTEAGVIKVGDGVTAFPTLDAALGGGTAGPATFTSITPDTVTEDGDVLFTVVGTNFPVPPLESGTLAASLGSAGYVPGLTVNEAGTQFQFTATFDHLSNPPAGPLDLILTLFEAGGESSTELLRVPGAVTYTPPEEPGPAMFTSITPDTATDAGPTSFTVVGTGLPANVNGGCKIGFVGKPLVWGTVNPARTQVTFNFTFNNPADTPGTYDLTMWTADDFSSDPIAEVLTAPDVVTYTPA